MALWLSTNEAHVRVFWYLRDNQMYPEDAEMADFSSCANFSVCRMQYWNKGFESSDIFYRKCEAVAKGMDRYFRENRAEYETTVNRDVALANLISVLSDDKAVLADLGPLCDECYRFGAERV